MPYLGVTPFEFHQDLWRQVTRLWLSYSIVSVMLHFGRRSTCDGRRMDRHKHNIYYASI